METIKRIHHISAIVGNAQENYQFYCHILGLRLIKQTLNFEDKNVYHLYFSDEQVSPGFVMTFFPWERNFLGRKGSGQIGRIAFRVPKGYLSQWQTHLEANGIETKMTQLFKRPTLEFQDVHTLDLALVESDVERPTKDIIGFHGVVLLTAFPKLTSDVLANQFQLIERGNGHYQTHGLERHEIIVPEETYLRGRWGIGTVHHIAWSVSNMRELEQWQDKLYQTLPVTEIKNRKYFQSIYLQDENSITYEFATDGPGFDVDEPFEQLGQQLQIPPHFEHEREAIIAQLKPLILS